MAQYNITAPDGTKYQVTAPDDATQDQVMAYVQSQHAPAQQQQVIPAATTITGQQQPDADFSDFASALGHHAMNALHGGAQLVEHGVGAAAGLLPQGNAVRQYIQNTVASDDAALANREKQYQQATPTNAGSLAGAAVGEIAPWMLGMGELRAAGALPEVATLPGKVGALMGEGAAMGATQPVTEGDYAKQKAAQIATGAITSPLAVALGAGAAKAGGAVRDAASLLSDSGRNSLADKRLASLLALTGDQNAAQTLANAQPLVPGEKVSIAQALQNPKAVQIERMLRNDPNAGPQLVAAQNANDQARMGVLQGIAGTPEQAQAAKAARDAAVAPYRQNVLAQTNVDPTPVVEAMTGLSKNANPVVRGAAGEALNVIQMNQLPDGTVPATVLDDIRQQGGKLLSKYSTNGVVGSSENARFAPAISSITDALNEHAPGYSDYLAAYARGSEPINTMEGVRRLVDPNAPGGLNASGDPAVSAARIKAFLRSDDRARYPISDEARAQLESVRASLERQGIADNKIGTNGSDTAANLKLPSLASKLNATRGGSIGAALGATLGYATGVPAMGEIAGASAGSGIGALLGRGAERANADVISRVGQRAADSQAAAAAIRRAQQSGKLTAVQRALISRLLPYQVAQ